MDRPRRIDCPGRRRWLVALAVGLAVRPAHAQVVSGSTSPPSESNPAEPAAGHSVHGEAFDDGPRHRATILPGMGRADFPVSSHKGAEVQPFINQGVAQLHSFYYFEAERSFRQAALIDPDGPMAYWGMAMANVNNPARARGFLKQAHARAAKLGDGQKLSRRESLYLDALDALYRDGASDRDAKKAYLLALETIVQEFPGDLEARAWMGMVAWQNASADGIGSRQAVDMVLDSVVEADPLHPGAHHYRIHLWDHVKPTRAVKSADAYAGTAPGIAHAWHMPGHTYTELKRYADAAYQQEGSARVDHAAMARDRVMPFEIHNYAHNNQWLATSLANVGQARKAILVARNLVEQPRDPKKNDPADGGSAGRSGRLRWAEILDKFELWDELILAAESGAIDWTDTPAEQVDRAYMLGLGHAARGDLAKLDQQVAALAKIANQKPPEPPKVAGAPSPADPNAARPSSASGPLAELEGYRSLARGDVSAAFDSFAKATRMRPEALARAHLKARNFGLAESIIRSAVARQPEQFAPLAAEAEVLALCGKAEEAKTAYRKLAEVGEGADADLPVLGRLAALLPAEPIASPGRSAEDRSRRVPLEPLGPLTWTPFDAPRLSALDTEGSRWSMGDRRGKNVVILFYLGGKCPHCMEQLKAFGKQMPAFGELNTEIVAVGTDPVDLARELKHNNQGVEFPMPLLADPDFVAFKDYGVFDDFEGMPLHGAFLIDDRGKVRFQRVSADPFLDVEFLKAEATRVDRIAR